MDAYAVLLEGLVKDSNDRKPSRVSAFTPRTK